MAEKLKTIIYFFSLKKRTAKITKVIKLTKKTGVKIKSTSAKPVFAGALLADSLFKIIAIITIAANIKTPPESISPLFKFLSSLLSLLSLGDFIAIIVV
jgi:hypothetical protein